MSFCTVIVTKTATETASAWQLKGDILSQPGDGSVTVSSLIVYPLYLRRGRLCLVTQLCGEDCVRGGQSVAVFVCVSVRVCVCLCVYVCVCMQQCFCACVVDVRSLKLY